MTDAEVATLREDLAAAFRITAQMGWSESVGNHFSAAVSADGKQFLLNRKWQHFASIRPEDLMLLDADDPDVMNRPDAPDASAWSPPGPAGTSSKSQQHLRQALELLRLAYASRTQAR